MMRTLLAIETVVETLTAVPEYDDPLDPIYSTLQKERPLTLYAIRQHTALLHTHAQLAQDQTLAINRVIASCKQLMPIPMLDIPLGF